VVIDLSSSVAAIAALAALALAAHSFAFAIATYFYLALATLAVICRSILGQCAASGVLTHGAGLAAEGIIAIENRSGLAVFVSMGETADAGMCRSTSGGLAS